MTLSESVLSILEPYVNHNAAYNSTEREKEEATICQPGTRTRVLNQIQGWVRGDGPSVMWLYGPAGAGKSTIAHTTAEQCDNQSSTNLAFSYFFSRRNLDRNDMTKFIPTFAYQLVRKLPSLGPRIREAYEADPVVFRQRLQDQVQRLIIYPLWKMLAQTPQMILPTMTVVIDGLDEYSEESGGVSLSQLTRIFFNDLECLPFRIFFASRPEPYIRAIFDKLSTDAKTMMIPVSDWETSDDVYRYLSLNLSEVQTRKRLPPSWPSRSDVRTLVNKSEGIFIYASTLIKFVGANNCNSKDRLQEAMKSHNGLDPLFVQVLDSAKEHADFQYTLGVIMHTRKRLPIGVLAPFLERDTHNIRSSFEGALSIFIVPDTDEDYIRPYHASLQDFLTDRRRSGNHFLDPVTTHAAIVEACAGLIAQDSGSDTVSTEHLFYAYRNWCYHLRLALSNENYFVINRSPFPSICNVLAERLLSQDITWLRRMRSYEKAEEGLAKLRQVIPYVEVRDYTMTNSNYN